MRIVQRPPRSQREPREGELPAADLYLCTCVPGGEEFEIYIVGLEREVT